MQNKYYELREKHPVFTYDNYEITDLKDKLILRYVFRLGDDIMFTPSWEFIKKHKDISYAQEEIIHKLAFHLGLVELISYWKCACSPLCRIKAGYINKEQIAWWKQQYFLGLGEFFYTNGIVTSLNEFMTMEVEHPKEEASYNKKHAFDKEGCLIPVGGGKDSIVTLELLKDRKSSNLCYMINKKEASERCAVAAGYKEEEQLIAKRSLDAKLLDLNKEGYLNGHTPFSAIVAFSSVLQAYLWDKKYVVLSNEASANESTVEGTLVNHQYSKSFKFEKDFTDYVDQYIKSGVKYFSLLRPFSELQIARYFSLHEKYYSIFRSCNAGSKVDKWCGNCPKCLFVYIILSPFIEIERMKDIFGRDMLSDENLIPTFDKLIGLIPEKPFECVGTVEEANMAVCMTIHKLETLKLKLPKLYEYYKNKGLYTNPTCFIKSSEIGKQTNLTIEKSLNYESKKEENPYIKYFNEENLVPEEFIGKLKALMLNE